MLDQRGLAAAEEAGDTVTGKRASGEA